MAPSVDWQLQMESQSLRISNMAIKYNVLGQLNLNQASEENLCSCFRKNSDNLKQILV